MCFSYLQFIPTAVYRLDPSPEPFYFSALSLAIIISSPGIIFGPFWGSFAGPYKLEIAQV